MFRCALQLLLEVLVILDMTFALLVLYRFNQIWKIEKRPVPAHVLLVAASYYLLLVGLATREADWRMIFYVPALGLGIASMVVLLRLGRTKR